jgi:hypothetical protein
MGCDAREPAAGAYAAQFVGQEFELLNVLEIKTSVHFVSHVTAPTGRTGAAVVASQRMSWVNGSVESTEVTDAEGVYLK